MSVSVELDEVHQQVAQCRSCAYLLTVTADGRPHAVSVAPTWDGDHLVARVGRHSGANAGARPNLSLLWPVAGRPGYALIVDGEAEVRAEGDATLLVLRPTGAVLHRTPDPEADGPSCIPVLGH